MSPALYRSMLYHQLMGLEFMEFLYHQGEFTFFILFDPWRQEQQLGFYQASLYLGRAKLSGPNIHWLDPLEHKKTLIPFEEVLENSSPEIQEKLLFNLDLFR